MPSKIGRTPMWTIIRDPVLQSRVKKSHNHVLVGPALPSYRTFGHAFASVLSWRKISIHMDITLNSSHLLGRCKISPYPQKKAPHAFKSRKSQLAAKNFSGQAYRLLSLPCCFKVEGTNSSFTCQVCHCRHIIGFWFCFSQFLTHLIARHFGTHPIISWNRLQFHNEVVLWLRKPASETPKYWLKFWRSVQVAQWHHKW